MWAALACLAACATLLATPAALADGSRATPSSATRPAAPASNRNGLIWRARGPAGGNVYIAGSMHLLRDADAALPASYQQAYGEAERLVMEIDVDDVDPAAAAAFTASHATYPPGAGLRQALGERRWSRARGAFAELGIDLETLDRLEPWAVALLYSVTGMTQLGLDPQLGVEEQLKRRALADAKPITGLETLEFQLGLFDALSPAEQAELLDMTLEDTAGSSREIDRLTRAWRDGDEALLARLLLREYRRFPALFEPLVNGRNRDWVPQVEALLARPDDTLVVVGALHLVGEQGLISLLRRRGIVLEPVTAAGAPGSATLH